VLDGLNEGWEGKGVGELCFESRLCYGDWKKGEGKGWRNFETLLKSLDDESEGKTI